MADKKSAWAGAGRNGSYNNESPLAVLKALAGMIGSAGRSSAATSLGALGDLTRLGYTLTGNEQPAKGTTIFPDSSDVKRRNGIFGQQMIPNLPQDMRSSTYEGLGGMLPMTPELAGKIAMTPVGKGALATLAGMHGFPGAAGVIKPVGGQWLNNGSLEEMLKGLKTGLIDDGKTMIAKGMLTPEQVKARPEWPANQWINGALTKYVKNRMGSPDDEIRKLADQGVSHLPPWEGAPYPLGGADGLGAPAGSLVPLSRSGENSRQRVPPMEGFSPSQMATTPEGKRWEDLVDKELTTSPAKKLKNNFHLPDNPWLTKVSDNTPVSDLSLRGDDVPKDLNPRFGFDHILDYISQATDPASAMPRELRLNPANLNKFSMEQAVKNTSAWNNHLAAQEEKANQAVANNPAHHLVKEYPEDGFKWVEIKNPVVDDDAAWESLKAAKEQDLGRSLTDEERGVLGQELDQSGKAGMGHLEEALKFEGDSMGHCVGGYADDVASGQSRIFSLRDKNGKPHVTIETSPQKSEFDSLRNTDRSWDVWDSLEGKLSPEELSHVLQDYSGDPQGLLDEFPKYLNDESETQEMLDTIQGMLPEGAVPLENRFSKERGGFSVQQIKGKGNNRPVDAYQPYVTDFLKSQGPWSDVGDIHHTNLIPLKSGKYLDKDEILNEASQIHVTADPEQPGFEDIPGGTFMPYNEYVKRSNWDLSTQEGKDLAFRNALGIMQAPEGSIWKYLDSLPPE